MGGICEPPVLYGLVWPGWSLAGTCGEDRLRTVDAAHFNGNRQSGPGQHLVRSLPGEGEQEDGVRVSALFDEPRHPVGEGAGLAASGPCYHQDRAVRGADGLVLGGVKVFLVINAHFMERFHQVRGAHAPRKKHSTVGWVVLPEGQVHPTLLNHLKNVG